MIKKILGPATGLFFVLVSALPAQALTVSPVLFDNTLDKGQNTQGTIKLTNDTNTDQTYYASVQNFVVRGEEGQQTFLSEDDTTGLVKWITLDQPSVVVRPNERKDFAWSVTVPKDAEPGGHYAAIFFTTTAPTTETTGVGIGAKTGVLMLVNVNGDIKESAKLESFTVEHFGDESNSSPFFDRNPVVFDSRISNTGSVHIQPTGKIVIRNMAGHITATVDMNTKNSRVLPNSIRRVRGIWGLNEQIPVTFIEELGAEWKGLAFGRYTATLEGFYGKQRQLLQGSVVFYVFPWRLSLVAIAILAFLFLLLKAYNNFIVKQAMKRSR